MKSVICLVLAVSCAAFVSAVGRDGGVGPQTGVQWSIQSAQNGGYMVRLSSNSFPAGSWIGLGLNLAPQMTGAFIISCAKAATGQVVVQSRYAYAHQRPPLTPWGMQPVPSNEPNTCVAMIPPTLSNPPGQQRNVAGPQPKPSYERVAGGALNLAGPQPVYVLNAGGPLDPSGEMLMHNRKEVVKTLTLV